MKSITRFTKNIRGNKCLNCENSISEEDNFCSRCGQVNDLKKVSLKQYLSAYFDDFLSFDSRLLNTIVGLIFKPGFVTKNYVDGKRMSYVNPFKLYIQITILFFLLIGIFGTIDKFKPVTHNTTDIVPELNAEKGREVLDSIKSETLKELEENNVQIDSSTLSIIETQLEGFSINKDSLQNQLEKQSNYNKLLIYAYVDSISDNPELLDDFKKDSNSSAKKDSLLIKILQAIDQKARALTDDDKDVNVNAWSEVSDGWEEISKKDNLKKKAVKHLDSIFKAKEINYEIPLALVRESGEDPTNGKIVRVLNKVKSFMDFQKEEPDVDAPSAIEKLGYEKNYWNVFLYSKSTDWNDAVEDPEIFGAQMVDRVVSRISIALFFLLPIFTLMVTLLYIRKKFNYTENLVFVFHVQTVFFLLLLIFLIANRIVPSNAIYFIFVLTFMLYLYKAMRKFYGQGWFKTFIKYIILNISFVILAIIGGVIVSFLAFLS